MDYRLIDEYRNYLKTLDNPIYNSTQYNLASSKFEELFFKLFNLGDNIIILTDSYKVTHWKQYPKSSEIVYSYLESRGGLFDVTVMFGLQYIIMKYLEGQVITKEKIDEAETFFTAHLGDKSLFNREGWEYILNVHGGRLPIKIKAVPEGTVVNTHNVLITVENTDPKCYWLTNYIETLLVEVWYPITVATLSYHIKQIIMKYLMETGDPSLIDFKLHDFGFRGVSSVESAGIGGCAHLVNFKGSDTMAALVIARDYYDCQMAGFSIPASEHSTITSWGREHEDDAMENMLIQYKGKRACVSDSFDIFTACGTIWGQKLKDKILQLDGDLVIRPDSGNPLDVIPQVLDILGDRFGTTINSKGYKLLHPKIRIIQGDGVDITSIEAILEMMKQKGWSADNIGFGSGGALLQKLNRDTQKFAFKCSAIRINGKWNDVYKEPITDVGKNSKRGRLKLIQSCGENYKTYYQTLNQDAPHFYTQLRDQLVDVFENGKMLNITTLDQIRERIKYGY
jgi:nicotinamide phosphoribosyltransferase